MSEAAGTKREKVKAFLGVVFGKYLVPVVFFISLIGFPVIFFVFNKYLSPASSWYNPAWEYRKAITITYSGAGLSDYPILVEEDTSTLILGNKIQNDCDDIIFLDSDDQTQLNHWIESGCDSANTQIWVDVPSVPDGGKTIYMYYGNGSVANSEQSWSGSINLLSKSSCPVGWTRNSDADGRFLLGGASYGTLAGGGTHSHTDVSCTSDSIFGAAGTAALSGSFTAANSSHTHASIQATIDAAAEQLPEYIDAVLCSQTGQDFLATTGLISYFESLPSGWTRESAFDGLYTRFASSYGATGGSASHTHSYTASASPSGDFSGSVSTTIDSLGTGVDGDVTFSANTNINTTNRIAGRTCSQGGDAVNYSVTGAVTANSAFLTPIPAAGCLNVGDEILLINLQGISSNTTNVGNYEFLRLWSVNTGTGEITFSKSSTEWIGKSNYYGDSSTDNNIGTGASNQKVMVQRVPNYNDVTVNGGVTVNANSWNGTRGGVLAFKANGTVVVNGVISTSGAGYRGGAGGGGSSVTPGGEAFCGTTGGGYGGASSTGGWGQVGVCGGGGGNYVNATNSGSATGGGGGGAANYQTGANYRYGASGGGGGFAGAGGAGLSGYSPTYGGAGGAGTSGYGGRESGFVDVDEVNQRHSGGGGGGGTYGIANLSKMYFGSGGGGGGGGSSGGGAAAGNGGGIIYIGANTLTVNGSVSSQGGNGSNGTYNGFGGSGAGGGGAGGSIYIASSSATLGTSKVVASGGSAGSSPWSGGAGGTGRVAVKGTSSGSTNPAFTAIASSSASYTSSHTHQAQSGNTGSSANNPPYLTMILGSADTDTVFPVGSIAIFDSLPPIGWVNESSLFSKFPVGGATYGVTGGNASHNHSISLSTGGPSSTVTGLFSGSSQSVAGTTHTHSCTTSLSGVGYWPPHMAVIYGKKVENSVDGVSISISSEESNTPQPPGAVAATGLSTSSIRWNFTDNSVSETGVKVYDTVDALQVDCVGSNLTYCDEAGLSPNTQYTRKFTAYNGNGESDFSAETSRYTLMPQIGLSAEALTSDSITLTASGDANLTLGSSGLYFDCVSSNCDTGINEWIQDATDVVTGLSPNTQYGFQVKGRNGDGVETAYSSTVYVYTLAEVPDISFLEIGYNYMYVNVNNSVNNGMGLSGTYIECLSYGCNTGVNEWVQSSSDVAIGLGINTLYEFSAKSRNGDGIETASSDSISAYTHSRVPYAPVVDVLSDTSVHITLPLFPNSPLIPLAMFEEVSGKYVWYSMQFSDTIDWKAWGSWGSSSGKTMTGLTPGTNYRFKNKSRNFDLVETNWGAVTSVYTKLTTPIMQVPTALSSTSIRWNFTDPNSLETGVRIYDDQSNLMVECSGADITYCDETGLSPNETYTRVAVAFNTNTTSADSISIQGVTLAEAVDFNSIDITSDSATFDITVGQNPITTEILIQDENSGEYVDMSTGTMTNFEYWDAYEDFGQATSYTVSGLSDNTEYSFKIKARNSDGIETSFSLPFVVYTLSSVPGLSLSSSNASSVTVEVDPGTNPASTEFAVYDFGTGQYIDNTDGSQSVTEVWANYVGWGSGTGVIIPGLNPNEEYSYQIKSRNGDSVETSLSSQFMIYTLAQSPTVNDLSANSSTVIVVEIAPQSNPVSTEYAIYENNSGNYVSSSTGVLQQGADWATYASFGGASGIGVVGLTPNTSYDFRIKARNGDQVETSLSTSASIYTFANEPLEPTVESVSTSEIRITINSNGNPAYTEYEIAYLPPSQYFYVDGDNSTLVDGGVDYGHFWTYTEFGGASGIVVGGLASGQIYEFQVKARNGDLVETSYSGVQGGQTSMAAPIVGTPDVVNSSTITWKFTQNEAIEDGVRVYDLDYVQKAQCAQDAQECTEYGLSPNTEYSRRIALYNSVQGVGEYSGITTAVTQANLPTAITLEAISSTSINLTFDGNNNPDITEYLIQEVTSGNYLNYSTGRLSAVEIWGTRDEFGGDEGAAIIELFANAKYTFVVKARNLDGVDTLNTEPVEAYTLAVKPGTPYAVADSSTSVQLQLSTGGNPPLTEYYVKETTLNKFVDTQSGSLKVDEYTGTYVDYGRTSGFRVTGLQPNTKYKFEVGVLNGDDVLSSEKALVEVYTLANIPNAVTPQNVLTTSLSVALGEANNPSITEFAIYEERTGKYLNVNTGELGSVPYWRRGSVLNGVQVLRLTPGGQYRFSVKARNGDGVETVLSTGSSVVMRPAIPRVYDGSAITTEAIRMRIFTNSNSPSVQYLVYDESAQQYINKNGFGYTTAESWGTYEEFGGNNGFVIAGLNPASDYSFRITARNTQGVLSGYGARSVVGTNAILLNIPEGILARLKADENLDPTQNDGSQRGEQSIRFRKGEHIVVDLPVLFDQNRNAEQLIADTDPDTNRAAVDAGDFRGTDTKFALYVVKGETNRFRLCPKADNIGEVTTDCPGSVLFIGPFPQTIPIEGSDVTVSIEIIDGVEYWVANGLSGTGGMGEYVEGTEPIRPIVNPEPEDPTGDSGTETIGEPSITFSEIETPAQAVTYAVESVNRVATQIPVTTQEVVDGVVDVLDKTVGTLPEQQATTVSTVATATTVTVGLAAVGGGLGSIPYYLMQIIMGILSFLGFRKKGKPYGYVYDSVTKIPLSRAVVRIYDMKENLVWTDVTDRFGAFNADLERGKYKILVRKPAYIFPSSLVVGLSDSPLEPIYHGEVVTMGGSKRDNLIIPLDPRGGEKAKRLSVAAKSRIEFVINQIHLIIFAAGLVLAIYTYNKFPTDVNIAILAMYIPSLFMVVNRLFAPRRGFAKVKFADGKPAIDIEIGLKELEFDQYVGKRITDEKGMYRFLAPKGIYKLEVLTKGYKAVKYEGGSSVVDVRDEGGVLIAKDITVTKKVKEKDKKQRGRKKD